MNTNLKQEITSAKKANYGIDAPGVIRNLFLGGVALCAVAIFFPLIKIGSVDIDASGLIWSGLGCSLGGVLMLAYSLYGKFKHRDRMLNYITWTGKENVLDIGTGRGLLMIGAAKRLTTGKSTGIDIWNAEDLSGNNMLNTVNNAEAEGVSNKIEILNENVMNMGFANDSFDVILSNMVIHNIYNKEGRKTACEEISRVLKPSGKAVISDYKHVKEYYNNFRSLGLYAELLPANYFTTFPAVSTVIVRKNNANL